MRIYVNSANKKYDFSVGDLSENDMRMHHFTKNICYYNHCKELILKYHTYINIK